MRYLIHCVYEERVFRGQNGREVVMGYHLESSKSTRINTTSSTPSPPFVPFRPGCTGPVSLKHDPSTSRLVKPGPEGDGLGDVPCRAAAEVQHRDHGGAAVGALEGEGAG